MEPNYNSNPIIMPSPKKSKKIITYIMRIGMLVLCCYLSYNYGVKSVPVNEAKEETIETIPNWQEKYTKVLETTYCPADSIGSYNCYYYLYDLDSNDVPELIVKIGLSEADYVGDIYTIKNDEVLKLEQIPLGNTSLEENNGKLIYNNAHQGMQKAYEITMKDYVLSQTKLIDAENIEIYTEYTKLPYKNITDHSLINNY